MKKNLIYAGMLLLGMTVATGCSNEEVLEQVLNDGTTIQAVIENTAETRTSVNDAFETTWTTGDAFTVWNDDTKVGTLTLSDGEGTTSGIFTASGDLNLQDGSIALFPASDSKIYEFAASYTSQETDAPMLGTYAGGKFTFNLLAPMVRVVVANVPVGNAVLAISSASETLTGEATLGDDNTLDVPVSGSQEVTVTINNQTADATLTFDVPVPAQNYSVGLSLKLTVDGTEVFDKQTNEFNAIAGNIYVFGVTYVSVDGDNVEATLQNALESGEVVVLAGTEGEVAVSSLTLPTKTTATLDLNGKTLVLGESASTMALGRAATSTHGLINNGTLTIANGNITWSDPNDRSLYAIKNEIGATMNIDGCKIAGPVWNLGAMYVTNESEITTDIDVRSALICGADKKDYAWTFTMEGGSIISEKHTAAVLMNNYYELNPMGLAKLDGVTLETGNSEGSAYDVYLAAVNVEMNGCTLVNDKVYLQAKDYVSYVGGVATIQEDKCCKWSEIFPASNVE